MEKQESDERTADFSCGIGSWRPQWLQKYATPKVFLINFSLVAICQGASFTYLMGSITTLEKRYEFESKISGFILIADNISQLIINPFIGYLGSKYNRPLIMAIGEMIVAFSCFMSAVPYFIYGSKDSFQMNDTKNALTLCENDRNLTAFCEENSGSVTKWPAVYILWSASFINGLGYTAFYTVGLPYMDDNTSKKNSPMYLSFSGSLRLLGPSSGFLLSSFCLKLFENPFQQTNITPTNPEWIGAWWIGFVIIGSCLILFSIPLMIFPTQMPNNSQTLQLDDSAMDSLKRVLTNPIFMFHTFGMCFRILGYLGYYLFKPKYIEAQFKKSASDANFWTGLLSIPTMAIGIMAGGIFMSKFRPGSRKIVIYIFVIDLITNLAILSVMFIRCPNPVFPQTSLINSNLDLNAMCNQNCNCNTNLFRPVCADDKVSNYFNPCFAGCTQYGSTKSEFSECSCIDSHSVVSTGYCKTDCNKFPVYISVLAIAGIIMSSAKIGDTLITLRCVEPRDKNFAMGIVGSFLAVFAFIPYPLIFGTITDMACIVWNESCGKSGNCWLYDIEKFRYFLHLGSFGLIMIGTIFVIPVIFYANRIENMFEDEDQNDNKSYELGSVNNGFDHSIEATNNDTNRISVVKIITNLTEDQRKESLKDYELVHRKNSFVVL